MLQFLQDHSSAILGSLLAISEGLSLIPGLKSNGIMQAIVNFLKSAVAPKA